MRSICTPKSSEEIVECADAKRIVRLETAENGIDGYDAKRTNPVIDAHPEFGHEQRTAKHVSGIARRTERNPEDLFTVELLKQRQGDGSIGLAVVD